MINPNFDKINFTDNTHQVLNQPKLNCIDNLYLSDPKLQYWIICFSGQFAADTLRQCGKEYAEKYVELGEDANRYPPEFESHDRNGHRIDVVKFHPAYHQLMRFGIESNIHSLPWINKQVGAQVVRAAMEYMHMQVEAGTGCPLTMTFAAVATLKHSPKIAEQWIPKILSSVYDSRNIPYFEKQGLTIGMAMTEKQGGSDVRANTTRAFAITEAGNGEAYELVGHKWFCSAPMSDAFLVLAQLEQGLSCFLMPRWRPDGSKNHFHIQRLKNKLGNRSNASSEIEFHGAFAWLIGEEGKGVRTIIDMVALTRFDCMVGSSALMRSALSHALTFTSQRSAFGKNLQQQPLMQNVLADLAIESEAALALSMRVAHALDSAQDKQQMAFVRIATAAGKYWICKRAPHFIYEAMECMGGMGYVEDNFIARLYREAPVNAIWEGSGNVQCLDVMRSMIKEPETLEYLLTELQAVKGQYSQYDALLVDVTQHLSPKNRCDSRFEYLLRSLVDKLALLLQAYVLIKFGKPQIAQAYCLSRLVQGVTLNIGTLPTGIDVEFIIKEAMR
ncbi:MAG: isovaleryl-CoA dehydrogenase [Parashewanella sp.]